jgi:addiction module HigA family antidote
MASVKAAAPGRFKMRGEPDYASHPGELLGEELEARGMTRAEFARLTQLRPEAVGQLIRGKRSITADIALELEAALGISARLWLDLQTSYDLVEGRRRRLERSA